VPVPGPGVCGLSLTLQTPLPPESHRCPVNWLSINVLHSLDEPKKRAVGFKLSEGMKVPAELGSFKFARQKSKLAGTIRGSYFNIKGEY